MMLVMAIGIANTVLAAGTGPLDDAKSRFAVLGGFGDAVPGWGATKTSVREADLVFRYDRLVTESLGRSWYRTRHRMFIEIPVGLMFEPKTAPILETTFLACFESAVPRENGWTPYFMAGGGPIYLGTPIPGMARRLNGSFQIGAGVRTRSNNGTAFNFELRAHHVSNASTKKPNDPLNSFRILAGVTFR
jgi:hypothetical protein